MNPHSFLEPHSRAIRVWHWTFVLFISATISVVLLASTIFRTRNTFLLVQQQLGEKGISTTPDQARAVAHGFNDLLWDLHRWIGYGLCILLVSRWLIELGQPRDERLQIRLQKARVFRSVIPIEMIQRRQYVNVKATYLFFYTIVGVMAITGLILAFDDIRQLEDIRPLARELHNLLQYVIYAFIGIHLINVIRADLGHHKGIVSGMIHGKKLG
ncbi:MAG TPA: cytochrome b/b6 domain-containing protein [Puia sp.]|jgi:Ni/Fe-hydrogenase 1 B-type cytochrome subunit|nr:cytochrome b/b6 domain-containing protein [Puia sp.]